MASQVRFLSLCVYLLFIKYIQTFSECNEQCEQH